eukprot:1157308-Pelagomonas_calceolata.AAC.5
MAGTRQDCRSCKRELKNLKDTVPHELVSVVKRGGSLMLTFKQNCLEWIMQKLPRNATFRGQVYFTWFNQSRQHLHLVGSLGMPIAAGMVLGTIIPRTIEYYVYNNFRRMD